jgi:hypothetical protein
MPDRIVRSHYFLRIGEIIVPFLTWFIILLPIWLSPFHPAVVAYLILAFDLHFFYQSLRTAYQASMGYKAILAMQHVPFFKKVQELPEAQQVKHFIIIPNYKEPLYKLESTIQSIIDNDYPYKTFNLVLAFEKREDEATTKAEILIQKFKDYFLDIIPTYHVLAPHEVPGKASNQTSAARQIDQYCQNKGYNPEEVVITICDADSHMPVNYFSYLTHEFVKDQERKYHFYWAPVLLYANFWQLPFFVRMQATLSSIMRLAFISYKEHLIHISTYSTNLWLLKQVDFWDVDIIPEDWHIYYQAFFKFGEKVRTMPLYTIISGDAVYSGGMLKTFLNRYDQEKRWAWGVTDVAYAWKHMFITPHIRLSVKLRKIWFLAETHLLWPISFFILTLSASIPPLVNPVFKRTVLGFLLPQLSGLILTLSTAMLIIYIYLDIKLRQKVKIETKLTSLPFLLIQWYLLPIVSFVLSALPALEAHTRLLLGKKITYKVTEKV